MITVESMDVKREMLRKKNKLKGLKLWLEEDYKEYNRAEGSEGFRRNNRAKGEDGIRRYNGAGGRDGFRGSNRANRT